MTFIAKQRKLSSISGGGVQYIPGHLDPFVDLVLSKFLPPGGLILDLGGGGLRFALPVAESGRSVTVVDLDPSGLDLKMVLAQVKENDGTSSDLQEVSEQIDVHVESALEFMRRCSMTCNLITSFRMLSFFTPAELSELIYLVHSSLATGGTFAFSALAKWDSSEPGQINEYYSSTEEVSGKTLLYRRFKATRQAQEVKRRDNLPSCLHFVDDEFVSGIASQRGFDVLVSDYRSTRVVAGYVLKKR